MSQTNSGEIKISVKKIVYPYTIYINNVKYLENIVTDEDIILTGLNSKDYSIKIIDGNNNVVIKNIFLPRNVGVNFEYEVTDSTSTNYLDPNGAITIKNITNQNSALNKYTLIVRYQKVYALLNYYDAADTYDFTGTTYTINNMGYSSDGDYEITLKQQDCINNIKTTNNIVVKSVPYVENGQVLNLSRTSFTLSQNKVTFTGGNPVTEIGVYCSTGSTPTSTDTGITMTTTNNGDYFTTIINNLKAGVNYNTRCYGNNILGTGYSEFINTKTASDIPTLFTSTPINITSSGATFGAYDIVNNGEVITEKGINITSGIRTQMIGESSQNTDTLITGDTIWFSNLYNYDDYNEISPLPSWLNIGFINYTDDNFLFTRTGSTIGEEFEFTNTWNFYMKINIDPANIHALDRWVAPKISEYGNPEANIKVKNDYYTGATETRFSLVGLSLIYYIPANQTTGYVVTESGGFTPYKFSYQNIISSGTFKSSDFYFMSVKTEKIIIMQEDINFIGATISCNLGLGGFNDYISTNNINIKQVVSPLKLVAPIGGDANFTLNNAIELNPNTTYQVEAYATNSIGTGYGNTLEFTTLIS